MPELATPKKSAGWTTVALGDVVKLSKERSSDPEADGYERYIGLEHIDPGELRVRRWGDIADGVTFTNVFKPGQVLFGKRRAYQRKVAVADFSGVCSGDIYVLEPTGDELLPELLPFICQTDAFFEHAVGTSAGSLSPRTNWKSLATFEFALPSLEEQRRMVSVLKAASHLRDRLFGLVRAAQDAQASHARAVLDSMNGENTSMQQLHAVCERVSVGIASSATHAYRDSGVLLIRNMNIKAGTIDLTDTLYIDPAFDAQNKSKRVRTGDVVTARTGVPGESAVVPESLSGCQTFTTLISTPQRDVLESAFLCLWINSPYGREFINSRAAGGVQKNMNSAWLKEMPIRVPPLNVQRSIVDATTQSRDAVRIAIDRLEESSHLTKRLCEAMLCGSGSGGEA